MIGLPIGLLTQLKLFLRCLVRKLLDVHMLSISHIDVGCTNEMNTCRQSMLDRWKGQWRGTNAVRDERDTTGSKWRYYWSGSQEQAQSLVSET